MHHLQPSYYKGLHNLERGCEVLASHGQGDDVCHSVLDTM